MTALYQKIALIMSSNYYGVNSLHGCVNDGNSIKQFLIEERGFDPLNVTTLYDKKMTHLAMWDEMAKLVESTYAIANLSPPQIPAVFMYYSGHGLIIPNKNPAKSEAKGDCAIVPYNYDHGGIDGSFITDDQLFERVVKKIHPSTQMFVFTDCCFSGSLMDLSYMNMNVKYIDHDVEAKIIALSGCNDRETSAEVGGHGLATSAFLKFMQADEKADATILDLKEHMSNVNLRNHPQHPQVSVSNADMISKGEKLFPWIIEGEVTEQLKNLRALKGPVREGEESAKRALQKKSSLAPRKDGFLKRLTEGIMYGFGKSGVLCKCNMLCKCKYSIECKCTKASDCKCKVVYKMDCQSEQKEGEDAYGKKSDEKDAYGKKSDEKDAYAGKDQKVKSS